MTNPDANPHAVAHLTARLSGEEGTDHPRQRLVHWLKDQGQSIRIPLINEYVEQSGHADRTIYNLEDALDFAYCWLLSPRQEARFIKSAVYPRGDFVRDALTYACGADEYRSAFVGDPKPDAD